MTEKSLPLTPHPYLHRGQYLVQFPTMHGAADINDEDHILRHHRKALGCEEVHKVAIDYLERGEAD